MTDAALLSDPIEVAVVDKSPLVVRGLQSLFAEDGRFELVATAPDGERLLDALGRVPLEVVVTGWVMPCCDGRSFLERLRGRPDAPRVVVYTGDPDPTLPHPDFSPLFDGASNGGLLLELARDSDGKPVDVLEINGNITDMRAERIEDLLWNLIPEAGHLRDRVGQIDVANGLRVSHPLALTQLLVGYHMVKAALGIHAV